jgi:hypothetical protein
MEETYDAFISHASEDKREFVLPLADLLSKLGLRVWYDDFTLTVGDSLSRSIDRGLVKSRFGIVVLSPAFLVKNWPEYELRGLTSREVEGEKVILPIWHRITRADLLQYSPSLADKRALDTSRQTVQEIALSLLRVIRPELFDHIYRTLEWRRRVSEATPELVPIREIKRSPIRHETLPKGILLRIKLVHLVLEPVNAISLDRMINNFRRDLRPEDELRIWENIAAAYLEAIRGKDLSLPEKKQIFTDLLGISFRSASLPDATVQEGHAARLAKIYDSVIPRIPADDTED